MSLSVSVSVSACGSVSVPACLRLIVLSTPRESKKNAFSSHSLFKTSPSLDSKTRPSPLIHPSLPLSVNLHVSCVNLHVSCVNLHVSLSTCMRHVSASDAPLSGRLSLPLSLSPFPPSPSPPSLCTCVCACVCICVCAYVKYAWGDLTHKMCVCVLTSDMRG